MNTWLRMMIVVCCLSSLLMLSASASAQDEASEYSAWTAKEVPAETMERVINGNLFVPSQRRAPRVEPPPGETGEEPAEAQKYEPEPEPEDPDRMYRFIGSSYTGDRWLAFFENQQTREVFRVGEDEAFASGKLGSINYNAVEYHVGDNQRDIQIGYDLTGALASGSFGSGSTSYYGSSGGYGSSSSERDSDDSASSSNDSSGTGSSTADILRRLRERRERESQ